MLKMLGILIVVLFMFLAFYSFGQNNYLAAILQFVPAALKLLQLKYPENSNLRMLATEIGPVPKNNLRLSEYSLQMMLFSLKCGLCIGLVLSLGLTFNVEYPNNPLLLAIFALALPILFGMALLAVIYFTLTYGYVRISGYDRVWSDDED